MIEKLFQEVLKASRLSLSYYHSLSDSMVHQKEDGSLVTDADIAVSNALKEGLQELTHDIEIVSEEDPLEKSRAIFNRSSKFWLIDPIDGTWSFANRIGDFVINLALIEDGEPVLGIISAPLEEMMYIGDVKSGALYGLSYDGKKIELNPRKTFDGGYNLLLSASLISEEVQTFMNSCNVLSSRSVFSAYKFMMMVDGRGDIYPRLKKTYTWDTAAGHALLKAAGGDIVDKNNDSLIYNAAIENPNFVAVINKSVVNNRMLDAL